jgi:hypothetical protein
MLTTIYNPRQDDYILRGFLHSIPVSTAVFTPQMLFLFNFFGVMIPMCRGIQDGYYNYNGLRMFSAYRLYSCCI